MPEYLQTYDGKTNVTVNERALNILVVSTTATATEKLKFTDGDTNLEIIDGAIEVYVN